MTTTKQVIAVCDQETKDLIAGFVRTIQNTLITESECNPFYIIPVNIIHLCLSYYFILEKFVAKGNKFIEITENGTMIENKHEEWDTVYGSLDIDCNSKINQNKIFEWNFKIYNNSDHCAAIGIDIHERKFVNENIKGESGAYTLEACGLIHISDIVNDDDWDPSNPAFIEGDHIKMVFNVSDKTLIYYNTNDNDNKREIARIDDIATVNKIYCMAVYLWVGGRIKLTNFAMISK